MIKFNVYENKFFLQEFSTENFQLVKQRAVRGL